MFIKFYECVPQCYKFRKEAGLDTILKDYTPDPELEKLFPYDITGYDKEGCPSKRFYALYLSCYELFKMQNLLLSLIMI